MARGFDLSALGIHAPDAIYNPSLGLLYEDGVVCDGDWITSTGALATNSGDRTRRSPRDRRLVECAAIEAQIDWNEFNQRLGETSYHAVRKAALEYFNTCGRLYVVDGYFGWDPELRLKVRVICARPYHALFMRTMLVRPTTEELAEFATPDVLILNAGQTPADPKTPGLSSAMNVSIQLAAGEVVILGSDYAGEMKAALFTLANYRFAQQAALVVRAAAVESTDGRSTLLIGLPGTGKTTLAAGGDALLVADDAVAWNDKGLSNLEGGCYLRCGSFATAEQPALQRAVRFGAVLENVVIDPRTRLADYRDTTLTDNTRAAVPLELFANAKLPACTNSPANVVLLACDASGVLPPVSRLSTEQAAYYYLSGYSAKLSGPGGSHAEAVFSPCHGAALGVLPPDVYLELFRRLLPSSGAQVWLVSTGWTGGPLGTGTRITLEQSRAILAAIHSGKVAPDCQSTDPVFGFQVPAGIPGVPAEILKPWSAWQDLDAYRAAANRLAEQFQENFQQFSGAVSSCIATAGPRAAAVLSGRS